MYSVILILLLTTINTGDGEFVKCIAQCIELKDCEEVQLLHKEKGITPTICGFNGTEPKVCCSENDEKTLFTFHYGGLRKAEKKCKEFDPPKVYRRKDEVPFSAVSPAHGYSVRSGFRFMAALGYGNLENIIYRCGGFLIEKNVVITAAHCTELNGEPPSHVLIGSYSTSSNENKPIRVLKVISHPNYDNKTYLNDIAIIILAEDSTQRPACLFTQRLNLRHDNRTIAVGFGTTSFGGPFAKELIQVFMNIIHNRACENEYKTQSIADSQLCVLGETRYYENGTSGVQDTCQGDSGGPLVLHRKDDYVVGIVSNGRFCGSEVPGIYTYIASYTGWIKSTILKEADGKELHECDKLETPYRTLRTCDQDGRTGIACNSIAYIGDLDKYESQGFGFMVALGYGDVKNPEYKCDGFFVDYNVVITAAQCAAINGELPLVVRTIYEHHLTGVETQLIKVAKVIPHPNYQSKTYLNDIAILFLVEKSNSLTKEYSCLFTSSLNFSSVNRALAFSYGTTSFDGPLSNDLFVVPMNISKKSICEDKFKSKPLADSQLCGLTHFDYVGEDTYQGNSGGPIVLNNFLASSDTSYIINGKIVIGPYYVIGIISYGQVPGVFTNITSYLDWIESIVWPMGTEKETQYIA